MRTKLCSVILAATALAMVFDDVPQAWASCPSGWCDPGTESEKIAREDMQKTVFKRLAGSVRQVGDPNAVVPPGQVASLAQGWNQMLSLVKPPLQQSGIFRAGLMSGFLNMAKQLGPGGLSAPQGYGVNANLDPSDANANKVVTTDQPKPGKILANPIVAYALPISGAGGRCPQGSLLDTCKDQNFADQPKPVNGQRPKEQPQPFQCSGNYDCR
jgi:hypothetical protein